MNAPWLSRHRCIVSCSQVLLNCVWREHIHASGRFSVSCSWWPRNSKVYTENEVSMLKHLKLNRGWHVHGEWKKYEDSSQDQRSRKNVTNFQPLLAFPMRHISTKLHWFPTSSLRFSANRQTDRHIDAAKNNICSQHAKRKTKMLRVIIRYKPISASTHTISRSMNGSDMHLVSSHKMQLRSSVIFFSHVEYPVHTGLLQLSNNVTMMTINVLLSCYE